MKKSIILILMLLYAISLFCQDLDSEIRNYKESDNIYISKARQFIADELRNGNLEKVKELLSLLTEKFSGSLNLPLQPWEQFVLGIATDSLEITILSIDFIVNESNWNRYIFPEKDALYLLLDEYLVNDREYILKYLNSSDLSDEKIMVVQIFLDTFSKDLMGDVDQDMVNKKCDTFLENYPTSVYYDFIRNEIRNVWIQGKWGYGFDFSVGYNTHDNDLGNYFRDGVVFDFSLYATYKRTALRFVVGIASMNSSRDFTQNGEWKKGDHFNLTFYGLEAGYELFESKRLKFEPHLFAGGSQIDFSEGEDKTDEVLLPSWSYGAGFSLYYKLSKSIQMEYRPQNGFWYLSLNCDYLMPTFSERYDDFSGNSLFITLGLGGYARPMVRDL